VREATVQTSILIARLLGPVLLVMGAALLTRPEAFRRLAREFVESDALLFLSGVITLPAGLAIVNLHTSWHGWPAVITLLGWLMVFAGIARMTLPGPLRSLGGAMLGNTSGIVVPGAVVAALGAFLSWKGYFG
jgi:uncharacterized protein YjeT (DUF2065 family)